MALIISLALTVLAWFRGVAQKHPHAPAVTAALWVWMWILIWANTANPDLQGYLYLYNSNFTTEGIGPGYWFLVRTARSVGLDYPTFLAITAGLALTIMAVVARWFTERTTIVAVLYFLYPFAYDAIQARNLLAMSLVILGLGLQSRIAKHGWIALVSLTVIAATIHVTMLLFLLTIPALGKSGHIYAKGSMTIGVIATPVIAFLPSTITPLADFVIGQAGSRYESYFSSRGSVGVLAFAALHLSSLAVLHYTQIIVRPPLTSSICLDAQNVARRVKFVSVIYRVALIFTIFLPFAAINSNFFRILRNLWFLYAVAFSVGIGFENRIHGGRRMLLYVALLTLLHSLFFIAFDAQGVADSILNNNRLLDSPGP